MLCSKKPITTIFYKDSKSVHYPIYLPCKCPYCDKIVEMKRIHGIAHETLYGDEGILITECPSCNGYSATLYTDLLTPIGKQAAYPFQQLPQSNETEKIMVPDEITNISPSFQDLLDQASKAEANNLNDLAAIGYRRALEFLIKDFCIYKWPDETDKIKEEHLHAAIQRLKEISPIIENVANKIKNIGNDHTHYVKKYPYTYQEMKKLIEILIPFIHGALMLEITL